MIKVVNTKDKIKASLGTVIINIMRNHSVLGNPFYLSQFDRMTVLIKYRGWLWNKIKNEDQKVLKALYQIKQEVINGMDVYLECCCSPKGCHGDIIKSCIEWMISEDVNSNRRFGRLHEAYALEYDFNKSKN